MSPMNPRRGAGSGSGALMSPGVSIGGAVASMNSSHGLGPMRPGSPPSSSIAARRRLMGGMKKTEGR
jgi:vacuole morphology and inheritance protein 14